MNNDTFAGGGIALMIFIIGMGAGVTLAQWMGCV